MHTGGIHGALPKKRPAPSHRNRPNGVFGCKKSARQSKADRAVTVSVDFTSEPLKLPCEPAHASSRTPEQSSAQSSPMRAGGAHARTVLRACSSGSGCAMHRSIRECVPSSARIPEARRDDTSNSLNLPALRAAPVMDRRILGEYLEAARAAPTTRRGREVANFFR